MAISFGLVLSVLRQRAARTMSAVESGPPETASTKTGHCSRPAKSDLASDCETAEDSAVATLLFLCDVALHLRRRLRIFAANLGQGRASRFLLVQRRQRLTETQQRLGRLAGFLIFGGDREERFRRLAIALLLILTLAQPELRVRHHLVVRIFAH